MGEVRRFGAAGGGGGLRNTGGLAQFQKRGSFSFSASGKAYASFSAEQWEQAKTPAAALFAQMSSPSAACACILTELETDVRMDVGGVSAILCRLVRTGANIELRVRTENSSSQLSFDSGTAFCITGN